jgi:two-component system chemotaxis family response regulator WspR
VVGEVLDRETRKGDLAARYGGEEFAVLLPATTPGVLRAIAERVRRAVEARVVPFEGRDLRVTDSVGGACVRCTDLPDMPAALIRAADRCLYRAKDEGRNRVLVLPEPIDLPDAPEIER